MSTDPRLERLLDFFRALGPTAVAFSGGVDSSLTLWAAATALRDKALGVSIRSEFICGAERERAERMAAFLGRGAGARVAVRSVSVLACERLRHNPEDRCYLCKQLVLAEVRAEATAAFGPAARMADGTNADDDPARPGLRALAEAGAVSPLAACGLTKRDVRELARLVGLPNAEDPSNSCLATRVPTGAELTFARLTAIEGMERAARDQGLEDLRARLVPAKNGDAVRLQVRPAQMLLARSLARQLEERAHFIGFTHFELGERT
ncbi:MAG: TIGR00268 family protein [Desulfovibrio sp.]|jgi:uncharacterized protein|nr:TIGR00268 family protein [Desulfovibrio sp.]